MERTTILIQPTTFCNIACKYCYLPYKNEKSQITTETLTRILERVFASQLIRDPIRILWHASEPLVVSQAFYEKAFELCKNVNKRFGRTYTQNLQTNATLITDKWIELFKNYNVSVGVSIDGPDFIHDRSRITRTGKGTHALALRGIKKLQAGGVNFGVITVLTAFSLNYPDEMWDFFENNGITSVGFNVEETEGANVTSSLDKTDSEEKLMVTAHALLWRLLDLYIIATDIMSVLMNLYITQFFHFSGLKIHLLKLDGKISILHAFKILVNQ